VKWCVEGGYNQDHFESLPRGVWEMWEMWEMNVCVRAPVLSGSWGETGTGKFIAKNDKRLHEVTRTDKANKKRKQESNGESLATHGGQSY